MPEQRPERQTMYKMDSGHCSQRLLYPRSPNLLGLKVQSTLLPLTAGCFIRRRPLRVQGLLLFGQLPRPNLKENAFSLKQRSVGMLSSTGIELADETGAAQHGSSASERCQCDSKFCNIDHESEE